MNQIVLGIDPGLTRCGFGVISRRSSREVSFVEVGVIQSSSKMELTERIASIGSAVAKLLDDSKPDQVAIERVFAQQNMHTVMGVAQISGVVVYLCHERKIPVTFYTPTEVKAAVTGSGRANKSQVTNMVMKILKLKTMPKPADAADALAIAITAAWRGGNQILDKSKNTVETAAQQKWRTAISASKKL